MTEFNRDCDYNEYGENPVEDMMTDYDYHINTGDLPELFVESSVDLTTSLYNANSFTITSPTLTIGTELEMNEEKVSINNAVKKLKTAGT